MKDCWALNRRRFLGEENSGFIEYDIGPDTLTIGNGSRTAAFVVHHFWKRIQTGGISER